MIWLTPSHLLTSAQTAAVGADLTAPLILRGGPGSGKTVVLLHRAQSLGAKLGPSAKILTLVYTNVLRDFIRSAVADLGLDPSSVLTFDHWCRLRHEALIGPTPVNPKGLPDFGQIREHVLAHLRRRNVPPCLDAVLVDEGQDLDDACYQLLRLSARHLTVAFDNKQALYRETEEDDLLRSAGPGNIEIDLASTYRACPFVVDLACEFIPDLDERERFRRQSATVQVERQTPLLYRARDSADEQQRLVTILRERLQKNERVGILFPTFKQVGEFADFLRTQGILADQQTNMDKQGRRPSLDFTTGRPVVLTYHSAKGLTFDSVLMPGVTQSAIRAKESSVQRLLFVAITRATQWVYLSALETKTHADILEAMQKLQRCRTGLVQTRADLPRSTGPRPPTTANEDWKDI